MDLYFDFVTLMDLYSKSIDMYLAFGIFGFKHLGTVFLRLTICSHEVADLIGASTHRAGRSF